MSPMQVRNLPRITARYWFAITAASIFGANLGDLCSHNLGLGHVRGLPFLAVIFAGILIAERSSRFSTEAFYWAAIVTLRTAATNLGDLATHDLKLGYVRFIIVLAAALAAMVFAPSRRGRDRVVDYLPDTSALYWVTMLTAGTLGTALGDYCADQVGLDVSTLICLAIWAAALAAMLRGQWLNVASYWVTIVVVRTVGTNLGDYLAGRQGLHLGLPLSTTLSALAMVALLVAWPRRLGHAAAE